MIPLLQYFFVGQPGGRRRFLPQRSRVLGRYTMVHSMFPRGLVSAKRKPMEGRSQQGPHCLENSQVRQPFLGGKVGDRGDLQQREDGHCCRTRHGTNLGCAYRLRLSPEDVKGSSIWCRSSDNWGGFKEPGNPYTFRGMRNGDPKNRLLPSRYGLRATSAISGTHTTGGHIF